MKPIVCWAVHSMRTWPSSSAVCQPNGKTYSFRRRWKTSWRNRASALSQAMHLNGLSSQKWPPLIHWNNGTFYAQITIEIWCWLKHWDSIARTTRRRMWWFLRTRKSKFGSIHISLSTLIPFRSSDAVNYFRWRWMPLALKTCACTDSCGRRNVWRRWVNSNRIMCEPWSPQTLPVVV